MSLLSSCVGPSKGIAIWNHWYVTPSSSNNACDEDTDEAQSPRHVDARGEDSTEEIWLGLQQISGEKRQAQLEQAKKMIPTQGKSIEKQWASPGAVVVVQVDYHVVSHAIGIVGAIH